jgi:hypothetical protein
MSQKAKWDIVAAGIIFALAVFVLVSTYIGFGSAFADAGGVFPETLPRVYGIALLVFSVILAVEAWSRRNMSSAPVESDDPDGESEPPVNAAPFSMDLPWGRILGTLAAMIVFAFALPLLPFWPLSAAMLAALFVLYGHRSWVTIALVAGIGSLMMDVLFIRILNLPL